MEKLPGIAVTKWFQKHPESEENLLVEVGKMMARMHQVKVEGYGPFDNLKAKAGKLEGLHSTPGEAIRAGLEFNLDVLRKEDVITVLQKTAIEKLFSDDNPLLETECPVLIHNDFADWNMLTDGSTISGILDWDECVGGDPILDIACWSTFFDPERLNKFLEGYWQSAEKNPDFNDKFELFRLRYVLSKLTLRIRRYTWEKTEAVKERIRVGRLHLKESINYFDI